MLITISLDQKKTSRSGSVTRGLSLFVTVWSLDSQFIVVKRLLVYVNEIHHRDLSLFGFGLYIDVTEPLLIEVDRIYHLACPASPIFYKYNPVKVCVEYMFLYHFNIIRRKH